MHEAAANDGGHLVVAERADLDPLADPELVGVRPEARLLGPAAHDADARR